MKGLLLKEFYTFKKYGKTYLFLAFVFLAGSFFSDGNQIFTIYPCLFAGILPQSFIGMDEKNRWLSYCGALPYTKGEIVSSKYVLTLILQSAIILATAIVQCARLAIDSRFSLNAVFTLVSVFISVSLIAPSVMFPIIFKFGSERSRITIAVVLGLLFGLSAMFGVIAGFGGGVALPGAVLILAPLLALALFALSWYISVHIYEKREII